MQFVLEEHKAHCFPSAAGCSQPRVSPGNARSCPHFHGLREEASRPRNSRPSETKGKIGLSLFPVIFRKGFHEGLTPDKFPWHGGSYRIHNTHRFYSEASGPVQAEPSVQAPRVSILVAHGPRGRRAGGAGSGLSPARLPRRLSSWAGGSGRRLGSCEKARSWVTCPAALSFLA